MVKSADGSKLFLLIQTGISGKLLQSVWNRAGVGQCSGRHGELEGEVDVTRSGRASVAAPTLQSLPAPQARSPRKDGL